MKRMLAVLLALLLLPIGASAASAANRTQSTEPVAAPTRMEGPGFDTPEEAVAAYIAGLQHGDLKEMLAAFAIESYAEHYDAAAYIERVQTYNYATTPLPLEGEFALQLNTETRRNDVIAAIRKQYVGLLLKPEVEADQIQMMIQLKNYENSADLINSLFCDPDEVNFADIHFDGDFVEGLAWAVAPSFYFFSAQKNIYLNAAYYHPDETKSLNALVKIGGKDYFLFAFAIRYGDRWYLDQLYNAIPMHLAVDYSAVGMFIPVEETLGVDDATFEALWARYSGDEELMRMIGEYDQIIDLIDFSVIQREGDLNGFFSARLESLAEQIGERLGN